MGTEFNLFSIDKETRKLINVIPTDNDRVVALERYERIIKNIFNLDLPIIKYEGEILFGEIENEKDLDELMVKQDAIQEECRVFLASNDILNRLNKLNEQWVIENYPKKHLEERSSLDILKHGIFREGFGNLQKEWYEITEAIRNGAIYYYIE